MNGSTHHPTQGITIAAGEVRLAGDLTIPTDCRSIVLFAHGSGSSRFSSRNRYVARRLHDAGIATLLMDLLTAQEEQIDRQTAELRFDISMLAERVAATIDWLQADARTRGLAIGLFGASTGAAAALVAAAQRPHAVSAVVSRGGRVDLAGAALAQVRCPTLLIVGGHDSVVLGINQHAMRELTCAVELQVVEGAGHLFEEPGALEQVAELAHEWFRRYLLPPI